MPPMEMDNSTDNLRIRLFGPLDVELEGQAVTRVHSRKEQLLLALLILRCGEDVSRTNLAGLLWPDNYEEQSLAYLRRSLYLLKQSLGPESGRLQSPTPRSLRFDVSGAWVDVIAFDEAVAHPEPEALERAMALYRGPLLAGFDEEWVLPERERRMQAWLSALETLATYYLENGRSGEAKPLLRELIQSDPFRESAHRQLLKAYAHEGDYGSMILSYRAFRQRLREELNAEPAAETTSLFELLRQRGATRDNASPKQPAHEKNGANPPRKIPHSLTPLLGREQEVQEIKNSLAATPLVTLTGAGGVGKTRIALQMARDWPQTETAWFVELAPVTESTRIADVVARELAVVEDGQTSLENQVFRTLSKDSALLVLDNCEHILDSVTAFCHNLIRMCPNLRILATSRQAFGIPGELIYTVQPMDTPRVKSETPRGRQEPDKELVGVLMEYPVVHLFLQRAQSVLPSFRITPSNASQIAQICRQLDGIPLAIELAAARARTLSMDQILDRLGDRFRLLTTGVRPLLPHHQTLQALVDWSYELLAEQEKTLLHRLSIFAAGCTLEMAEKICADQETGLHSDMILDLITSLVDKSLVQVNVETVEPRYTLLETLREYGRQRLEAANETRLLENRHAEWCLRFAEESVRGIFGPERERYLNALDRERENLSTALERGMHGHIEVSVFTRLASVLGNYWTVRGRFSQARRWMEGAIAASTKTSDLEGRAHVLNSAGLMAYHLCDLDTSLARHQECLSIRRQIGDRRGIAGSLNNMGMVYHRLGDPHKAKQLYLEAMETNREIGNLAWQAINLNNLGEVAVAKGWQEEARSYLEECLRINRTLDNHVGISSANHNLGNLAVQRGEFERAHAHFVEAIADARELGDERSLSSYQLGAATAATKMKRMEEARERLRESLQLAKSGADADLISFIMGAVAEIAYRDNQPATAVRLLAAAAKMRERVGIPLTTVDQSALDNQTREVRDHMGEAAFGLAWTEGMEWEEEQAIRCASTELSKP